MLIPQQIITGYMTQMKHAALTLVTYVQVAKKRDNSMKTCATGAISLRTVRNQQETFQFMSLAPGRQLRRRKWIPLPIPRGVIDRVYTLAHTDPFRTTFYNRNLHAPVVCNHGKLGPCPRPWRGGGTDHRTTAICRFRARCEGLRAWHRKGEGGYGTGP